jgi:ribonuclease P protein component
LKNTIRTEKNKFNKSEKLKSRKSIEALFKTGKTIASPPFRMLYRKVDSLSAPVQMTVAVPKKLIKRAVDRNLLKRRTREAYRLNKSELLKKVSDKNEYFEILFLYQASGIIDYQTIRKAVNFLLIKLTERA